MNPEELVNRAYPFSPHPSISRRPRTKKVFDPTLSARRGLALAIMVIASSASANNWYVKPSSVGSNNGQNWNNAWSLSSIAWSSISPGDTIFLAGGSYSGISSGKSGSSGNPISMRRATAATCSGVAGWSSGFDSTISTPKITVVNNDFKISGETPSGIVINNAGNWDGFGIDMNHLSDVTVSYVEVTCGTPVGNSVGLRAYNMTGCTFDHLKLHHLVNGSQYYWNTTCVVQYCEFYDIGGFNNPAGAHPNVMYQNNTANCTYCYNLIHDNASGAMGIAWEDVAGGDNNYLYGNVFWNPQGDHGGIESDSNISSLGHFYIYNNTFVNFNTPTIEFRVNPAGGEVKNNLYYNCQDPYSHWSGLTWDYNWANTSSNVSGEAHSIGNGSNPFVNYSGLNFQIVSNISSTFPRGKGIALSSAYATDLNGNVRGADGSWDIGAYEYVSSVVQPPAIVTGVRLISTNAP